VSRPPQEHRDALITAVLRAGREQGQATIMFHAAVGASLGLGATDEKALDLLDRNGPMTPSEIGSQTGLAPASVTGLVGRLEAKGFVTRRPDPADARRVIVELRPDSAARAAPRFEDLRSRMVALFDAYDDDELIFIADLLTRIAAVQREATEHIVSATRTP
jgi:DNA-binding MarR family transcriptional regulator